MALRRSLCGFVDWNHIPLLLGHVICVEAFAASWIEIFWFIHLQFPACRSLCGFVDWNSIKESYRSLSPVEAFAASWIEIRNMQSPRRITTVEAFAASWIEIARTLSPSGIPGRRSLCGFVDWNPSGGKETDTGCGHHLAGGVDWNRLAPRGDRSLYGKLFWKDVDIIIGFGQK